MSFAAELGGTVTDRASTARMSVAANLLGSALPIAENRSKCRPLNPVKYLAKSALIWSACSWHQSPRSIAKSPMYSSPIQGS
jgi:hypothetical protein